MADDAMSTRRGIAGILFLEGVGQAYNVVSATNSSPQTTEVFGGADGGKRSKTLMKWVWVGHAQVFAFMGLASLIARSWWPLIGGGLVTGVMHGCYAHAKRCADRGEKAGGWGVGAPPTSSGAGTGRGGVPDTDGSRPAGPLGRPQSQVRMHGIEPANGNRPDTGRSSVAAGY